MQFHLVLTEETIFSLLQTNSLLSSHILSLLWNVLIALLWPTHTAHRAGPLYNFRVGRPGCRWMVHPHNPRLTTSTVKYSFTTMAKYHWHVMTSFQSGHLAITVNLFTLLTPHTPVTCLVSHDFSFLNNFRWRVAETTPVTFHTGKTSWETTAMRGYPSWTCWKLSCLAHRPAVQYNWSCHSCAWYMHIFIWPHTTMIFPRDFIYHVYRRHNYHDYGETQQNLRELLWTMNLLVTVMSHVCKMTSAQTVVFSQVLQAIDISALALPVKTHCGETFSGNMFNCAFHQLRDWRVLGSSGRYRYPHMTVYSIPQGPVTIYFSKITILNHIITELIVHVPCVHYLVHKAFLITNVYNCGKKPHHLPGIWGMLSI